MSKECQHERVKCLCCGDEGTPAHFLTSRKRTRSPEAAEQSRQAARQRRIDVTLQEAAEIVAGQTGEGKVVYKGHTFTRAEYLKSSFAGKRGGGVFGAKQYIRTTLEQAET